MFSSFLQLLNFFVLLRFFLCMSVQQLTHLFFVKLIIQCIYQRSVLDLRLIPHKASQDEIHTIAANILLMFSKFILLILNLISKRMVKSRGECCHLCNLKKANLAVCSIERCSSAFCFDCIKKTFDPNFCQSSYKKQFWVCYACGKICKCNMCRGILPPTRRRIFRQTQKKKHIEKDEMLEEERVEFTKFQDGNNPLSSPKKTEEYEDLYEEVQEFEHGNTGKKIIQNKHLYRRFQLLNFF